MRQTITTQHDKAKRWRPRFSVRTLVVAMTLVCATLSLCVETNRQGLVDVEMIATEQGCEVLIAKMVLPLFVKSVELSHKQATDEFERLVEADRIRDPDIEFWSASIQVPVHRRYYFWFFGYVAKLPYEREI